MQITSRAACRQRPMQTGRPRYNQDEVSRGSETCGHNKPPTARGPGFAASYRELSVVIQIDDR